MGPVQCSLDIPICIDGRMLGSGGTGVATYARMVQAASAMLSHRPMVLRARPARYAPAWLAALVPGHHEVTLTGDATNGLNLEGDDLYRRAHIHFGYRRQLYMLQNRAQPVGLMHWTYPVPLYMAGWINLYTVHDMIPINQPSLTPINAARHRAVLTAIAARADGIVTVSTDARQSIIAGLGCTPDFVVDAGQAVDIPAPTANGSPVTLPPGLVAGDYLLIVGSVEPRKNIVAMLAAYHQANIGIPLVIAGPDGWQSADINAAIAQTPGVIRLPYLERGTLMHVMANARALLFASLAEGFGLPMVEAMAMGIPVLTSDRGALAEVAGNAALLVDPGHSGELAQAIARIANDESLRAMLKQRGPERAQAFSLDRFAARLRVVYRDAVENSKANGRPLHGHSAARS